MSTSPVLMGSPPLSSPLLITPDSSSPPPSPPPSPLYRRVLLGLTALSCVLLALISYRYVLHVGFTPPNIAANPNRSPFLPLHVAGAATALLLGPFQLIKRLRSRYLTAHRITGRVYALACVLGGLAALPLAWGVSTGPVAGVGFGVLGVVWVGVTVYGVWLVRGGKVVEHREWMLRSMALTFAAVTLRLYIVVLPAVLGVTFEQAYVAAAWMCWVPNLGVMEGYIRRTREVGVKPVIEGVTVM